MILKLWLSAVCFLLMASTHAQTVYSLPANTKGNRLDLTISNGSATMRAEQVTVQAIKYPRSVSFKAATQSVEPIAPLGERTVTLAFDVGRGAPVNVIDTMEFLIADKNGSSWRKSILVSYLPPSTFSLEQNFPNPFNPSTTIYYQLPVEGKVILKVYNVLGEQVGALVDEQESAGYHEARFDASNLPNGVYFYRLQVSPTEKTSDAFASVRKMIVLK